MYPSHSDTQSELHFLDMFNFMNKMEYEHFVFPLDSMHLPYVYDGSQFDFYIQEHDTMKFHSEQGEESVSSFYMHYESDDGNFVLPNEVIESTVVLGKTKENESFSLPQEDVNENQVYDRGRKL